MSEHLLDTTAATDDQISESSGSVATAINRESTFERDNPGKEFGIAISETESAKRAWARPLSIPMDPDARDAALRPGTKRSGSVTETATPILAVEPVSRSFASPASMKPPAART